MSKKVIYLAWDAEEVESVEIVSWGVSGDVKEYKMKTVTKKARWQAADGDAEKLKNQIDAAKKYMADNMDDDRKNKRVIVE